MPTGLVIEVPAGIFLGIFARSSTPLKRGLMVANGVGVVDSDYCGPTDEIKMPVLNFTAAPVTVAKGDRIAQGILLPSPRVEWDEVGELRAGRAAASARRGRSARDGDNARWRSETPDRAGRIGPTFERRDRRRP